MKIRKITFKPNYSQCWVVIDSDDGDYMGTWHVTSQELTQQLKERMPKRIDLK